MVVQPKMEFKSYPFGIKIRKTPWDAKAFGIDTFELIFDEVDEGSEGTVFEKFNELIKLNNKSLLYCRLNSNLKVNKRILYRSGFNNVETQLHIVNGNIKRFTFPEQLGKRKLQISCANEEDYIAVSEISPLVFNFSRFHEDPFINKDLADLRMRFWCEYMHKIKMPLLVYRNRANELDSFIYYRNTNNSTIELVLGGSVPGRGMMTPLFWASFIDYFKNLGVSRIETKISASNISIANIYTFFNFIIKETYFDFHKHITP
jgi:hypothetical protein